MGWFQVDKHSQQNVSMTLCDWQVRETHVLCGCTTLGTKLNLGTKLIRSYAYCSLDKGVAYP